MTAEARPRRRKADRKPPSNGPRVVEFIETFCRQTEGEHAGQPLRLRPWQQDMLEKLFALRPDRRRKYRQALIGMPRKNGKSALGAGLALYLLLADREPGAEVYSCAGDRDQARIVFGTAKEMVQMDPDLSRRLTLYRDTIVDKAMNGVYRVLSAEAYSKEGLNPSGVIFDELHVQPNRELWDVMTLGSGTRRQPLVLAITTAGFDLEGTICGERYQYGKKVQSGEIDDPAFYFKWFEPETADCDWRDPAVWAECNPALGDFLYEEFLEQQVREKPENVFRRYFLNQWTATETGWIPYGAWDACQSDLVLDAALPLYVGIDIAHWVDSTAVAVCQRQETAEGTRYVVRARIWENPYPEGHSLHDEWRMNNVEVQDHLRALHAAYPVAACAVDGEILAGPMMSYDPWRFRKEAEELMGGGLAMTEFPQCVTPTTPVLMADGAPLTAEMIEVGDLVIGRDNEIGTVIATAPQRPSSCVKVSTKAGRTLVTTANHPFLVRRRSAGGYRDPQWVLASELRRGDRLVLALGYAAEKPSHTNPWEAWTLGLMLGDGDLVRGRVACMTPEIAARLGSLGPCTVTGSYVDVHGARGWLRSYGLHGERAWDKYVPRDILADGAEAQAAFLAGYLDADGGVDRVRSSGQLRVRWTSVSRQLLDDCQQMLASLGLSAGITRKSQAQSHWRTSWELYLGGREPCRLFWEMVAPYLTHPEKRERLAAIARMPDGEWRAKLRRRRQADLVVSVEATPELPTIGLTVSHGTHVTNGLVTHNTDQRMVPASQDLYEAILKGEVAHDGDPALARHVANVTADQRPRGWRMSKPKGSRRKIDAAIAAAIALHAAKTTVAPGEGPKSAYEDHDLIVAGF